RAASLPPTESVSMPTASKVLLGLIVVLAGVFIWLSAFVIEARSQWNTKIQTKSAELARVTRNLNTLEKGTDEACSEFQKLAEEVPRGGPDEARAEFQKRLNEARPEGDPRTKLLTIKFALEAALDKFVDQRVLDGYQQAATQLSELEKTPPIEETQFQNAV